MRRSDFHIEIPPELIAQQPLADRGASRLLHLDRGSGLLADRQFLDLVELIEPADLLVFNDTRVIPARLFGRKPSGGKVEVLVERLLDEHNALVRIRASKPPSPGSFIILEEAAQLRVGEREGELYCVHNDGRETLTDILHRLGHTPLPPYIRRADTVEDKDRYQTVYARHAGAVAAPTAGLHFSKESLAELMEKGVRFAWVTLHVGAGTFQPVRVDNIEAHEMHAEWLEVPAATCDAVRACRDRGGRVIAVGTTSVRSLETAAREGAPEPFRGDSRLFIYPGYRFRVVDALITNFHLSESTLLMLVSAFAGYDAVMAAYRHAVASKYRFFSYGDAMLIT